MSGRVSISMDSRDWTALLEHLDRYGHEASTPCGRVREGLRRAMEPRRRLRTIGSAIEGHRPEPKRKARRPGCTLCGRGFDDPPCGPYHALRQGANRSRKPSKEEKRESRAAIYDACWVRCGGRCECGCGQVAMRDVEGSARATLEHMFGRGRGRRPESVETCWILRYDCQREKTDSRPDGATWWAKFICHCQKWMTITAGSPEHARWCEVAAAAKARRRFVETRASLPAAPRTGGRTDG